MRDIQVCGCAGVRVCAGAGVCECGWGVRARMCGCGGAGVLRRLGRVRWGGGRGGWARRTSRLVRPRVRVRVRLELGLGSHLAVGAAEDVDGALQRREGLAHLVRVRVRVRDWGWGLG